MRSSVGGRPDSKLNIDGHPVQLCLSARADAVVGRWVVDPGCGHANRTDRLRQSRSVLDRLLAQAAGPGGREASEALLNAFGVGEKGPASQRLAADFWLARPLVGPGFALYLRLVSGLAWEPLRGGLEAVSSCRPALCRVIDALAPHAHPVSVALEGHTAADMRLKLYFGLLRPMALGDLQLDEMADPRLLEFLTVALGQQAVRPSGLTLAVGFGLRTGLVRDAKVDVCCCPRCLPSSPMHWSGKLKRLSDHFGLRSLPLPVAPTTVAVVGLGSRSDGERRLNLYLQERQGPGQTNYPGPRG